MIGRGVIWPLAVLGGALVGQPALAAPSTTAAQARFDIPAQALPAALAAFSSRTGRIVVAAPDLLKGRRSAPVAGAMSPPEALRRLLAGSGLDFVVQGGGAITIVQKRPAPSIVAKPILAPTSLNEPPLPISPVRVTGLRNADLGGLALKRAAMAPVDLLLGEAIRRTADLGLADAMLQLPGVSVSGDAGEGRQVAVRGLGGQFSRVRINGMEALATYGGSNAGGGTNRGRAFDYNVFASDLFKQIRLQKAASADIDEGSVGATVDLRTRSPFDGPSERGVLMVESAYNTGSDRLRPRVSAVLSRRFLDDRLGLLVSAAYSERSVLDAGSNAGQWQTGDTTFPGFGSADPSGPSLADLNAALHPRIPRLEAFQVEQKRLGLSATLQWRPSDRTTISLDTLYADLASSRREYLLETFSLRTTGACAMPSSPDCGINGVRVVDANVVTPRPGLPVLIAGTFDNIDVKSEARLDELRTLFRQTTLSVTRKVGAAISITGLLGFSRSDFSNPVQETLHLDQTGVSGFRYDFSDRAKPFIGFGDAKLVDPAAWSLAELRSDPNWVDNGFKTASLDLTWTPRDTLTVQVGATHKDYRTQAVTLNRSVGSVANVDDLIPDVLVQIAPATYTRLIQSGRFLTRRGTPDAWLAPDVTAAFASFQDACAAVTCGAFSQGPEPTLGLNYTINEHDDSAYVQLRWNQETPLPWRGELGLRYARTDQKSEGYDLMSAGSVLSPVTAGRTYDDLLPSLNLAADLTPSLVARFGAARTMARPDLRSLRPGVTISTNGLRSVSAGNPQLRPVRAHTLDAALEWYFAPDALLSLAVFHKSFDTTIQATITAPSVFATNPFGLPDSIARTACGQEAGCDPALPIWQFVQPQNVGGGRLDGAELALQTPLQALGDGFRGWSVRGAVSYAQSRINYRDTLGAPRSANNALGAPRIASTLALSYLGQHLEARASIAYRGSYLTATPAPTGGDVDGVNAVTTLDFSGRYRLSPDLWLTIEGINLTDARQRQFSDSADLPNYQHTTGREFRVGCRLRL